MSAEHVYFLTVTIVERDHMAILIQLHVTVTFCFRRFTVKERKSDFDHFVHAGPPYLSFELALNIYSIIYKMSTDKVST
ncbi:hypothetical protein D3C78_1538010 [compost metagenome]